MVAALILGFAVVALGQFWLSWWRATIGTVASQKLTDKLCAAIGMGGDELKGADFQSLMAFFETCPSLRKEAGKLVAVQRYYRIMSLLGRSFGAVPTVAAWAEREMATCARYAAVCLDQRMQHTRTVWAEMRSY